MRRKTEGSTVQNARKASRPGAEPSLTGPLQGNLDFDHIYDVHFEFVWRSLRVLGVEDSALADVTQEVFSTVARRLCHFEGRSSPRTWLFGIAQNTASNHRRWRARKLERLQPLESELESSEPTPLAHAEAREAAAAVLRFCAELEPERRVVFALGLLEGVPAPEIAQLLELPLNTVYSRIHALRKALERRLAEREVEK